MHELVKSIFIALDTYELDADFFFNVSLVIGSCQSYSGIYCEDLLIILILQLRRLLERPMRAGYLLSFNQIIIAPLASMGLQSMFESGIRSVSAQAKIQPSISRQ
jgi:hypothetical protein